MPAHNPTLTGLTASVRGVCSVRWTWNRYAGFVSDCQSVRYTMEIINPGFRTNRFSFARDVAVGPRRHTGIGIRTVVTPRELQNRAQLMVRVGA